MKKIFLVFLSMFWGTILFAHPMPNSVMVLNVGNKGIICQLQLPLKELQYAVPFDVTINTNNLLAKNGRKLANYVLAHFNVYSEKGKKWKLTISNLNIAKNEQTATGLYEELIVNLKIEPENENKIRRFIIAYDAIMHQVVTHKTLVVVKQDWQNGQTGEEHTEIGTINTNINTNKVPPFKVNLSEGSNWKGFKSMVSLGMKHISEGTDHLLFLLVLLVAAPLIASGNNWIGTGTTGYAIKRILKIITAFTLGHSVTLALGALGYLSVTTKLVEILIALSILVTAIHAIKPIFFNKEIYIASFFGLVHGLAFANVLVNLNLETNQIILSLLGFNLGIEFMQLLVIIMVMPWLLILSRFIVYKWVRLMGAIISGIAAMAWAIERYSEKSNFISIYLQNTSSYSVWIIVVLACFAILVFVLNKKSTKVLNKFYSFSSVKQP